MNKSLEFLRYALLVDSDGEKARIVDTEGAEKGHDCLVIYTQSTQNKKDGIRNKIKIYISEE